MRRVLTIACISALAGCATYVERSHGSTLVAAPERFDRGPAPRAETPAGAEAVAEAAETEQAPDAPPPASSPTAWGTALGDPALDAVLAEAVEVNFDVKAAILRVDQAIAVARQVRSARFPTIGAEGHGTYSSFVRPPFGRGRTWEVGFSLPVRYEVDLFGRYAVEHRAARLDAEAQERDAEAIAITVAAQVAEAWFDLVETRARRTLLQTQLATNQRYLEVVTLRFERGLTSVLDVNQQQQLVATTEAELALVDGEEAVVENELAILLGAAPDRRFAAAGAQLPELPAAPDAGVPADLLERRPDLHAAHLRVRAADERVAAAIRDQLPSLELTFTPGYTITRSRFSGSSTGSLPQNTQRGVTWVAGGSITVPIFDGLLGPSITAERRARVEELVASYRQTFLSALVEVENAIVLERQQRVNIAQLERQLEFANATLEAAQTRYRAGLSDYLPVLTALRAQQQVELGLLAARRQLVSQRIQLYRALGTSVDLGGR